jgi:hypothetical protein
MPFEIEKQVNVKKDIKSNEPPLSLEKTLQGLNNLSKFIIRLDYQCHCILEAEQ